MKDIIFINSHPIQYFAPLYKYMNKHGLKTKAWYCSDESVNGGMDKEFGVKVKWDVPLLEGYEYEFFKNYSWKPSYFNGFFGLMNLGLISKLFKIPKSVIVVHGYHYFTHFFVLFLAGLRGHTVCIRNDVPQSQENYKKGLKHTIRNLIFKFIFSGVDYCLYVGEQNKMFYKSFGIPDKKLLICPYAVDNDAFIEQKEILTHKTSEIRLKLGIDAHDKVIVFSGKYIDKKRPLDLLKAFNNLKDKTSWLILVGEGELRAEMEALINEKEIKNVILTGFVNQSTISEFYAIANVFVMCSGIGEHWGLSVNEAMNFDVPVILSDLTGCSTDLALNGINGYVFKTGDIDDLTDKIEQVFNNELSWEISSSKLISKYSYQADCDSLSLING